MAGPRMSQLMILTYYYYYYYYYHHHRYYYYDQFLSNSPDSQSSPLPGGVISGIGLTDLSVLSVPIWEMG